MSCAFIIKGARPAEGGTIRAGSGNRVVDARETTASFSRNLFSFLPPCTAAAVHRRFEADRQRILAVRAALGATRKVHAVPGFFFFLSVGWQYPRPFCSARLGAAGVVNCDAAESTGRSAVALNDNGGVIFVIYFPRSIRGGGLALFSAAVSPRAVFTRPEQR